MSNFVINTIKEALGEPKNIVPTERGPVHIWAYPSTDQVRVLNKLLGEYHKSIDKKGRWYRIWDLPESDAGIVRLTESHFYRTVATRYW